MSKDKYDTGLGKGSDGKIHLSIHDSGQVNIRTEGYPCGDGKGQSSKEAMDKLSKGSSLQKNK